MQFDEIKMSIDDRKKYAELYERKCREGRDRLAKLTPEDTAYIIKLEMSERYRFTTLVAWRVEVWKELLRGDKLEALENKKYLGLFDAEKDVKDIEAFNKEMKWTEARLATIDAGVIRRHEKCDPSQRVLANTFCT